MKQALALVLVLVVLFTGVPVVMGMPTMDCAECDLGVIIAGACLVAVVAAVGFVLVLVAVRLRQHSATLVSLLAASGLDRPPRLA